DAFGARVGSVGGATAATTAATLTLHSAPVVTTNPASQTVCPGSVTFTAGATGTPVPTVQWQVSTDGGTTFSDIAGATSTSYTLTDGKRGGEGKKGGVGRG